MGHTLKFNPAAVKALGGNVRVRVFTKTRSGETFFALRPSYRVSGKNVQLRVEAVEGEKYQTADMPAALSAQIEGLPELKNNHHYHLEDIGYQWFILKASDEDIDDKKPGVFVSKLREKAAKKTDDVQEHPEAKADTKTDSQETIVETGDALVATAESTGDSTGDSTVQEAPAEQAAASAKPKRVRPSRAKAKVDAPKAEAAPAEVAPADEQTTTTE